MQGELTRRIWEIYELTGMVPNLAEARPLADEAPDDELVSVMVDLLAQEVVTALQTMPEDLSRRARAERVSVMIRETLLRLAR